MKHIVIIIVMVIEHLYSTAHRARQIRGAQTDQRHLLL